MKREQLSEHDAMVTAMRPILAGHDPAIQSTVLAELVATWLAGHRDVKGDRRWQHEFRMHLLVDFEHLVLDLLPACEKQLDETLKGKKK